MVPRLALLIVFLVLSVFALPVETRADDGEAEQFGAALDSGGPPEGFQVHLASALEQVRQEPPQLSAEAPGLQQADLQFDPRGHDKSSGPLANGALSVLLEATEAGIHGPHLGIAMAADSVRVEVLHTADSTAIRDIVSSFGGSVYGEVPGHLVEATVPVDRLAALEATEEVQYLRPPLVANAPIEPAREESIVRPASVPLIGEQVQKMNAASWHNAGFTGQGVKVGIIDAFDENIWSAAQAAGEVPAPAGTFCLVFGQNCSVWDGASPHGVAVAEIIHEMAPAAQLYLAIVYTPTDIMAAVDYFASQGVQIISRSQTSEYDGPGDGTGPTAAAVDYAIEQGMIWLNAAGNAAGMGDSPGGYWRGNWSDPDGDGALNFGGDQELLPFVCGFLNGVRWSDWGSVNPTDYDVLVLDDPVLQIEKTASVDDQGAGAPPMESLLDEPDFFCADGLDIDFLVITLFNPANGTSGDILEFLTNTAILEFSSNPYSASGPMVDSFNGGMLAVGAIDPALGTTNAIYTSQGPTNDNRTKPDVSAAACVQSFSYFPDCFNGTSSATPAVAGAAALILGADLAGPGPRSGGLAGNPAALAAFIKSFTVERGVAGPDNIYGVGEVILGEPPDGTAPTPPPDGLVWGDLNCQGGANPVDALSVLRFDAGQSVNTNGCPHLGDSVAVQPRSGPPWVWGDVDCSGNIDPIDGLKLLRFDAGLSVAKADQNCPTVGDDLVDSGATATPTPVPTSSSPTATPTPAPTSATVTASPTVSPTPTAPPTATASPTPTASPTSIPGQPSNDCDDLSQPAPILDNDDQNPATLIFEIPGNGTILDLQLCVNINHTWVGDLFLVLEHEDTATAAIMMDVNPACDGNNVRVLLSDAAASFADDACSASPPAINGTLRPTSPLSVFDGESIGGTWVLHVFDLGQGDTGQVLGATIWSQTD